MDLVERQKLMESLKAKAKVSDCTVTSKVEAERDEFKIAITSQGIEQYYKGIPVGTLKVAELNDEEIELINVDAPSAAKELLDQFASSFKVERHAMAAASEGNIKTAAHDTQSGETWEVIQEKQLENQKVELHPRTKETRNVVTQKQLPEHGLRPGTYDITTEGQLRDERTTSMGPIEQRVTGRMKTET